MKRPPPELRPDELDLLLAVDRSSGRDEAIAAWRRWATGVDIDRVDGATFELLPRVQRRLEELGEAGADYRIPGIYRFSWSRNQLHLTAAAEIGRELERAGIGTCAIAGTWAGFDAVSDGGARPLREAALLIDPAAGRTALEVLQRGGREINCAAAERQLARTGSTAIAGADATAGSVRLWCRLPLQILGAAALLGRARVIPAAGVPVAVPARDERLIEICMDGIGGPPNRRLGWIVDAGDVLADDDIDWRQLRHSARERRITAHLYAALSYLNTRSPGCVPPTVLSALAERGSPRFERAALWARGRDSGVARALALGCDHHRRHQLLGQEDPLARPDLLDSLRLRHRAVGSSG